MKRDLPPADADADVPPWLEKIGITPTEYHSPRWALFDRFGVEVHHDGTDVADPPDPGRLLYFESARLTQQDDRKRYRGIAYVPLTAAERRLAADGCGDVELAVGLWTRAWLARVHESDAWMADDYRTRAKELRAMRKTKAITAEIAELDALAAEYEPLAAPPEDEVDDPRSDDPDFEGFLTEEEALSGKAPGDFTDADWNRALARVSRVARAKAAPRQRRRRCTYDELMEAEHDPTPWLVQGLIAPGVTLFAAPPKAGKSYFASQMALCIAGGKPFLGRETRKVKVAYFNLEEWEKMLQPRVKRIGAAHGIPVSGLPIEYIFDMTGGDIAVTDDLQAEIDAGAELVVLDVLAKVRNELLEDAQKNAYARDYAALSKFADFVVGRNPKVALLIVHHTNKGNHAEVLNRISGTQGLAGASHTNLVMSYLSALNLDEEAKKHAIKYRELLVVGKETEEDTLLIRKMENGGGWEVAPNETVDDVRTNTKAAQILQILHEAGDRFTSATDVCRAMLSLGKDERTPANELKNVRNLLLRLKHKGSVESERGHDGGYRLVGK